MTIFEIASIAGLLIGPVVGAWIAFKLQDRSQIRTRQLDVFRTLMRTRRTPLNADHVGALNLVEIDFADHEAVLAAHKKLFESFSKPLPRLEMEVERRDDDEQSRQRKESAYGSRLFEDRQRRLVEMLFAMGRALGYRLEQLEILEGGYHPTYYSNLEVQQELLREFWARLAKGEQAIPVRIQD